MRDENFAALKDGMEYLEKLSTAEREPVKQVDGSNMDKSLQVAASSDISPSFGPHSIDTRALVTVDEPELHTKKQDVSDVLSDPRVNGLVRIEEVLTLIYHDFLYLTTYDSVFQHPHMYMERQTHLLQKSWN